MTKPNLPLLPDPDLFTEARLDDSRSSSFYCRETLEQHALSAYRAGRNAGLEEAAGICDSQTKEPECPERASYCADAIRALKSDSEDGG